MKHVTLPKVIYTKIFMISNPRLQSLFCRQFCLNLIQLKASLKYIELQVFLPRYKQQIEDIFLFLQKYFYTT